LPLRRVGRDATGNLVPSAEPSDPSGSERRAPRERAFLAARVSYNNGAMSTPCTVLQLSATGAKIGLAETINLPDVFQIAIPQKSIERRARVVWRRGDVAAVAFLPNEAPDEPADALDDKARIKALRAENERLKAHIGKLTAQIARLTE
jgi:hypothetical protein